MSIPFPVLSINRVGEDAFVPLSALPIGHTRSIKDTQLVEISPMESSSDIMNKLCALPQLEGARRAPKKRKRTPTPPAAEGVEAVKQEGAAKEPSAQPEAAIRASTAEPPKEEQGVNGAETAPASEATSSSVVKKEDEDANGAIPALEQAEETTNGVIAKTEETKEEVKPDDDDPYADYTEEEKQQLVEDAIEDSEVASSPVLGFVHM